MQCCSFDHVPEMKVICKVVYSTARRMPSFLIEQREGARLSLKQAGQCLVLLLVAKSIATEVLRRCLLRDKYSTSIFITIWDGQEYTHQLAT